MALRSDDKIGVYRPTGGNSQEFFTVDEFNAFASAEEMARLDAIEATLDTLPTTITIIDDDAATEDLALTATSGTYVLVELSGTVGEVTTDYDLLLPAATGSGITIRIANKRASELDITANGAETIDEDSVITLTKHQFATLIDYAAGKWAQV